jgi:hypothetical protein
VEIKGGEGVENINTFAPMTQSDTTIDPNVHLEMIY